MTKEEKLQKIKEMFHPGTTGDKKELDVLDTLELLSKITQVGAQGDKGDVGDTGPQGEVGPIGPQGEVGPQGPEGKKGDRGVQGLVGEQGRKGDKGDKGDKGEAGKDATLLSKNELLNSVLDDIKKKKIHEISDVSDLVEFLKLGGFRGGGGSSSGSGGTPGGSDTQLQYNNAGAFGGITGATTNGTVVTLTAPIVETSLTVNYATASTIAIFDGSKNLISAALATYPSLTELSYLKGVTSAIQTQLNAKQNTLTLPLTSDLGGTGVANGSSNTITFAGGNFGLTLTQSGTTSVTLPTSGTLATLAGAETLTNKTVTDSTFTVLSSTGTNRKFVIDASAISDSSTMTLAFAASSGGKTITFPNSTGTLSLRGIAETIAGLKTMTALNVITHSSVGLLVRNPADTFSYIITGGAITTADKTLNLPVITGTDTLGALGMTQTWSGNNTFSGTFVASKTVTSSTILYGFGGNLPVRATYNSTNIYPDFLVNPDGGATANASLSLGFDTATYGGLFFGQGNGSLIVRSIPRALFKLTNSSNTNNAEHSDLSLYMKPASSSGVETAEQFVWTYDGRMYGKALHNNAGAMTGTTNQYVGSGTYTPTLTNVANISASTAYVCQWMRVGNVVTVSGRVAIDATTTLTLTQLGISLPIASALTIAEQCAGSINASAVNENGAILGDATNDRAEADITPVDVANRDYYFTFTYVVV